MNNKSIIKTLCNVNLVIHYLLLALVFAVSFIPFRNGQNFYSSLSDFFGIDIISCLMLFMLLASCVLCYISKKNAVVSAVIPFFSLIFLCVIYAPYVIEHSITSFKDKHISEDVIAYGIGFQIMSIAAAFVVIIDVVFLIMSYFLNLKKKY